MAVTLYRQVGKGGNRRYKKVNLGPGRRPADLAGPYFLRYSLQDGTRPWEPVGDDLDAAIEAQKQKQAYFDALAANVPVAQDQQDVARLKSHRHRLSMVERTSSPEGERPARQERKDHQSLHLPAWIFPRLLRPTQADVPRPD